jgi:hypothetical protein
VPQKQITREQSGKARGGSGEQSRQSRPVANRPIRFISIRRNKLSKNPFIYLSRPPAFWPDDDDTES